MFIYVLLSLVSISLFFTFLRQITRRRLVNTEREIYAFWTLLTYKNKVSILSQILETSSLESCDEEHLDQLFFSTLKKHCETVNAPDDINLEMLREQILTLNDSIAIKDNLNG